MAASFVALVPVKGTAVGKSRLAELGDGLRRSLTEALARDTVDACLASAAVDAVVVVSGDPATATWARARGCDVAADVPGGLNSSLGAAAGHAVTRWPSAIPMVCCADLAALDERVVSAVLAEAAEVLAGGSPGFDHASSVFVADAAGVGTTMYAANYDTFEPAFGPGSAALHRAAGGRQIAVDEPRARCDADTPEDLRAALRLGVGPRTAAVLTQAGWPMS